MKREDEVTDHDSGLDRDFLRMVFNVLEKEKTICTIECMNSL
jgi:hypothetical protein